MTTTLSRQAGLAALLAFGLVPGLAQAAEIDGSQLSVWWGVPFAGVLLSIALVPLLAPAFWHHHFGKVSAAWALAFLVPFAVVMGPGVAGASVLTARLDETLTNLAIKQDKDVTARMSAKELENLFDMAFHTKHVDTIFKRVFG